MHTGKSLLRIPYNPRKKKLSERSPPISRQLSYGIRQRNIQSKTQCGWRQFFQNMKERHRIQQLLSLGSDNRRTLKSRHGDTGYHPV